MPAASLHRLNIVQAAARLFRKQGYARTGLKDILAESKAPKGSLYHYFPDGKEQLGQEALRLSAASALETLRRLQQEHSSASSLLTAFGDQLADWMEQSGFQDGCPLATTVLEAAHESSTLRLAAREGFVSWQGVFSEALRSEGASTEEARRLANLSIAVLEGALIQARVELNRAPIVESVREVASLMDIRLGR